LAAVGELIRAAAARGARFVMTPEQTALIETDRERLFARVETEDRCRSLARLRALADELDIWLLVGSLGIRTAGERLANRSFLIAPDGAVVARYDKIHMFRSEERRVGKEGGPRCPPAHHTTDTRTRP